jgi:hypothetical protein
MSRRIVVELRDKAAEALAQSEKRYESNTTATVSRALRLLDLVGSQPKGSRLLIETPDGKQTEVLLL